MFDNWQSRTQLLVGNEGIDKLAKNHVLVVGLGGVGAYSAEMLCRSGIGEITIVDSDAVSKTNINRQLIALNSTIGVLKTELIAKRLLDINPQIRINIINDFLIEEKIINLLNSNKFDFIVDAIDTLSPKVSLIYESVKQKIPIVSSMGAGGKLDPTKIQIAEIENSYNCKFAFIIRKKLHRLNVRSGLKVVFSTEKVHKDAVVYNTEIEQNKITTVGTISYIPAIFGCFAASVVINNLLKL